jgi:hypothetical protein
VCVGSVLVQDHVDLQALGNLPVDGAQELQELAVPVGEATDRIGAVLPRWGFFDQHAARPGETDLGKLWGEVGPCLGTARVRLQQAMVSAAAAVPAQLGWR